jgi:hypothetical protein
MQAQFTEMRTAQTLAATQLTQLMTLMMQQQSTEQKTTLIPQQSNVSFGNVQINNAPVVTNNIVIQGLVPWDGPQRILISVADVLDAFASNPRLVEYSQMGDHRMTDPKNVPYAAELFTELAFRAHKSQESRNIYLDPNRADQAMVYLEVGDWAVTPLVDAIRLIFDAVATMLHKIIMSDVERMKFPPEQQNALSCAEMMYRDDPLAYVKAAKKPIMSHLTNCRAGRIPALRAR